MVNEPKKLYLVKIIFDANYYIRLFFDTKDEQINIMRQLEDALDNSLSTYGYTAKDGRILIIHLTYVKLITTYE